MSTINEASNPKPGLKDTGSKVNAEASSVEIVGSLSRPVRILGVAGSLRLNSYNRLLLKAAMKLVPASTELKIFEIDKIPLYNQDIEGTAFPEEVRTFKRKIEAADALIISTPEYNHSFPGVLKNAIDWASRPYGHNSFNGKPTAVISASPGLFGGVAAQDQLKQVLLALNTKLVPQPAVIVSLVQDKVDQDGNVLDPNTKQFMQQLIANLANLARLFSPDELTIAAPTIQPAIPKRLKPERRP